VTGGTGSIEVSYEGQTYYVCCTGCRDYFNENPAEVLAQYAARKEAERAKRAKK
jgi:YHS domain-containing protein